MAGELAGNCRLHAPGPQTLLSCSTPCRATATRRAGGRERIMAEQSKQSEPSDHGGKSPHAFMREALDVLLQAQSSSRVYADDANATAAPGFTRWDLGVDRRGIAEKYAPEE